MFLCLQFVITQKAKKKLKEKQSLPPRRFSRSLCSCNLFFLCYESPIKFGFYNDREQSEPKTFCGKNIN